MKLSIGMMVKNEEKNLERCLESLQPLREAIDSELIIVDTGSEDATVDIAKRYTDKVYFHPWNNNFSEMRNITISYAKGEWFLVMDADEVLVDTQPIIDFLRSKKDQREYAAVTFNGKNITDESDDKSFSILLTLHLFKNDGYFHYEGSIHNQPSFKGKVLALPVTLLHYGYIATDPELMERKFQRTSTILHKELEKDPENIYYWYQLSVTYAMHKDRDKAIEFIEKAYELFQKARPDNMMYVFTHMALMYQMVGNYARVAEICEESLTIKEGYVDIYYYLAEAQAILGKRPESIATYKKYLDIAEKYDQGIDKDVAVIDYTLGCIGLAYYNLSNLCKATGDFQGAVFYGEKVTDEKSIKQNFETMIYAYVKTEQYNQLRHYHDQKVKLEDRDDFYHIMEEVSPQFSEENRQAVAEQFIDLNHTYGLLCRVILEDSRGKPSEQLRADIDKIDLEFFPNYCSELFYYLIKWQYPLENIFINFREIWIANIFEYINKRHQDFNEKLYYYLQKSAAGNCLNGYKLGKTLCRLALLMNKLDDRQHREVFYKYIFAGISYMQEVYSSNVLDNLWVYDVKNDEEVFL
jgi:glycosyltransferase involved in cell wall biosynthesis